MKTNIGIDLGRSNTDKQTGIRYGVISQHSVGERWYEQAEADYGKPHCPKCGNEALDSGDDRIPPTAERLDWTYKGNDYACLECKYTFWFDHAFGDEPLGYSYENSDYKLSDCLDSDIFVLKSPFYTYAQFCSPCVPGAGNLDNPCEPDSGAPKTYCLGHDWFEDGKAPYRVWRVSDDSEVTIHSLNQ